MTWALCIGGASGALAEAEEALSWGPRYVVACNDIGTLWPHRLDAYVTLHPEKIEAWRDARRANGYPDADEYAAWGEYVPEWAQRAPWFGFDGTRDAPSSGMFAARWAMIEMGADRVVLAGVPLDRTRLHEHAPIPFEAGGSYREIVREMTPRRYAERIRSMSGWTAEHFGQASEEWANG